jgi:tetrahydromethanopterin S-methyltransferase subunit F
MASSVPARRTEKGRGHLLDMDAPRRVVQDPEKDARDLARVQRWVMSTLAVTTILHLVVGLVIAAVMLHEAPDSSRIGLDVIAGIFGAMAVATGLAIHGKRIASPWLLLGIVPTLVGLYLTFR